MPPQLQFFFCVKYSLWFSFHRTSTFIETNNRTKEWVTVNTALADDGVFGDDGLGFVVEVGVGPTVGVLVLVGWVGFLVDLSGWGVVELPCAGFSASAFASIGAPGDLFTCFSLGASAILGSGSASSGADLERASGRISSTVVGGYSFNVSSEPRECGWESLPKSLWEESESDLGAPGDLLTCTAAEMMGTSAKEIRRHTISGFSIMLE